MDVKNSQQNININTATVSAAKTTPKNNLSAKQTENKFADELKNVEETNNNKKEKNDTFLEQDVDNNKNDEKIAEENADCETKKTVNNAIYGLQDIVNEFNKIGQKDEINDEIIKTEDIFTDRKTNILEEDSVLIDNNMNIPEQIEKLNVQTEANMNFNSSEQPFSQFVNQTKSKEMLKSTASELAEEKAILSTMEENIAIANKNMLLKEKAANAQEENKTITVQNDKGIKKVDKKTHITVDTIVSYENVVMDKADVDFFVNLVDKGVINMNELQNAAKSSQVSKALADLLAKAMNENKPVRIDFDNDISVIIKIDRAGKISADFLPSSQIAEAYLKENLPLLRQRFDDNNIDYNELNQRKQKQESQDNRKKGRKDE